jgi:hypothetical protein
MRQLIRATALGFALSSLLVGCGGGGGGSGTGSTGSGSNSNMTVSGISGAPVAGGKVTIEGTDGPSKTVTATLDANGKASVDVSSLKAPYLIQVRGTVNGASVQYVSLATATDVGSTVSVNPLTDLAVAKAAAQTTQNLFANPANLSTVATNLPAAAKAVTDVVLPILKTIDPTATDDPKTIFKYDPAGAFHSKLDGLLDVITIAPQANSTNVTVAYKADPTNSVTFDQTAAGTPSALSSNSAISPTAVTTALAAIQTQVNALQSLLATSVPTTTQLAPLFDTTNFLDHGKNFTAFASQIPSNAVGSKISAISIAKVIDANTLRVRFTLINANGSANDPSEWQVNKVNGIWLFAGNQQQSVTITIHSEEVTDGNNYASGIRFNVAPNNDTFGQSIDHAVITGPGLPSGGITLVRGGMSWLTYANSNSQDNLLLMDGCPNMPSYTCGINTSIGPVTDNSVYNVQLFDTKNNLLNTGGYNVMLGKAPLMATDAQSRSASFATFKTPSVSPTSVTVSWNLPSWMSADTDNLYISGQTAQGTGYGGSYYHDSLAATATSTTDNISGLNLASAPNHINESVVLKDATGLRFRTNTLWQ